VEALDEAIGLRMPDFGSSVRDVVEGQGQLEIQAAFFCSNASQRSWRESIWRSSRIFWIVTFDNRLPSAINKASRRLHP
jgi:hypothetical protein